MDGITTSINSILKNLIKNFNTLLDCPVRFAGEYNGQKVHNFIEYIESYKRIKCITDEQALQELQFLLIDQAQAWWLRRISHLKTWSEALTFLENHFSKQRPPHVIYKELFKHNFEDYNIKEDFIDDKNELLDELTQLKLSEKSKLEVIYALLPTDIQTKIVFENIINLNDLKEQLQKLKYANEAVNLSEDQQHSNGNKKLNEHQDQYNIQTAVNATVNLDTNERDPIIKVRRTEDLMPHVNVEEQNCIAQQNEFIANDVQSTNNNNNTSHNSSNEHFQIDSDIMNQINNIIDESEMNTLQLNYKNYLLQKLSEYPTKLTQLTKKTKLRCSYCRRFNHTSQSCLKRAKHMKQFPEKFMTPKKKTASNDSQQASVNEVVIEPLMTNKNMDTTSAATSTEPSINNTSSVIIPEKCINSTLTTKLIAPINGPVPNKIMAAKLRNSNGHMPKCHQCGTVGFYKSICPNCSPIYNNNNQYK